MIIAGVLICLIALTSQVVYSKVITINITSSNSSQECCTKEGCMCASLAIALRYIDSYTTINITSSSVMLEERVKLGSGRASGSGHLTDITITGSNVTIMCNNSGSVYCESCNNMMIEGITWDRCGDPNGTNIAGVTFNGTSNVSLVNCTFQHSQTSAVTLLNVFGNISIIHCNFLSNRALQHSPLTDCHALTIDYSGSNVVYVNISDSYFYDNYMSCGTDVSNILSFWGTVPTVWHIIITKTSYFFNNGTVITFFISGNISVQLRDLTFGNNDARDLAYMLNFETRDFGQPLHKTENSISIINSNFTNNYHGSIHLSPIAPSVVITLVDVEISHNMVQPAAISGGALLPYVDGILIFRFVDTGAITNSYTAEVNLTRVSVMSNKCLGYDGGTVSIQHGAYDHSDSIWFIECEFFNNTSSRGAAVYIDNSHDNGGNTAFSILNSKIHHNHGDDSVIYLNNMYVTVHSSNFTDNVASAIYLVSSNLVQEGTVVFANNTADKGGAVYIDQESTIILQTRATNIQFVSNSATEYGGAIYVTLPYDCPDTPIRIDGLMFGHGDYSFVNNTARISGNSLYFYIPAQCKLETNFSDYHSILYTSCHFNYSQPVNGKMINIPCDLDYTLLNGTGAPIVTSPHELRLYFPFSEGYNISSTSDHNIYFIKNNVLGYPVKFTGNIFDYLGKPAEPTQFDVQSVNCSSSIVLPKVHFLVDNITILSITFIGANIENIENINVTFTSVVHSIKEITTTLVVELIPCIDHPGYTYSTAHKACVCYHHNVDCHDSYNEIKRGYWFGSVSNTATTAPCHHYCKFTDRTETRQGYFELPSTIDGQCNDHRVGRACGECSSEYTLSYDSTDCISVDQCGPGWTVLVITLTCLYWIAIVASVFGLMYFKFKISLGYFYGLIYYYSIIGILLDSNPNLSDDVFQFASVLSSFAQLIPQFLGKLCFVEGLSGIDQLFIHYSHAVGVSLLLLLIVVAARWSARVTLFVSHCIIRVICLLILLSYTSIVSTSLQLLQPLRFTDVKEWYTYSSPNIQYFHGRHAVYGVVAIICELVVGIGLPLLLLLQPLLSRKINFIRIKPLLDQFQGCYKDKHRWFAAYYLICRQVIFLITYSLNSNYYDMAFYLQTACVIIASIHMWIQPYQSNLLNGLDGVMLLLMIQANSYAYVNDSLTIVLEIITITLPLILFCAFFIRKAIYPCRKKECYYHYVNIDNADIDDGVAAEENIIRYVLYTYYLQVLIFIKSKQPFIAV